MSGAGDSAAGLLVLIVLRRARDETDATENLRLHGCDVEAWRQRPRYLGLRQQRDSKPGFRQSQDRRLARNLIAWLEWQPGVGKGLLQGT